MIFCAIVYVCKGTSVASKWRCSMYRAVEIAIGSWYWFIHQEWRESWTVFILPKQNVPVYAGISGELQEPN